MYVWDLCTLQRVFEHICRNPKLLFQFFDERFETCADYFKNGDIKIYSCTDNDMEIGERCVEPGIVLTCFDLFYEIDAVIFGTNKGTIRLYMWPFDNPFEK